MSNLAALCALSGADAKAAADRKAAKAEAKAAKTKADRTTAAGAK